MPGISRKAFSNHARRRVYSASITATESCGPVNASTAAHCAIEFVFEVECPWTFSIALVQSAGASAYPTRQPVIAYVFENDPAIHRRDRSSGGKLAALNTSPGG